MTISAFPRIQLAHLPTPLEPLNRLSDMLGGPRIFIKRDDCTGLALGGNKTRKLEFLIADALNLGADTIITAGGLQSNHVRQTAAAACKVGLSCHLVLQRYLDWEDEAYDESGNLLLDSLLGAVPHFCSEDISRDLEMKVVAEELTKSGAKPYIIPGGGANAIGGLGYAAAAGELLDQAKSGGVEIGHVVLASSSGSSQGGLVAGLEMNGSEIKVIGMDVDVPTLAVPQQVTNIANSTAALLQLPNVDLSARVTLNADYGGEGYGKPTDEMLEALRMIARLEGIILDPVYSGKAFAGLIDLVRQGYFSKEETVVFIHTGGIPGIFAYPSLFERLLPR